MANTAGDWKCSWKKRKKMTLKQKENGIKPPKNDIARYSQVLFLFFD
jgi:hypothetical protein